MIQELEAVNFQLNDQSRITKEIGQIVPQDIYLKYNTSIYFKMVCHHQ